MGIGGAISYSDDFVQDIIFINNFKQRTLYTAYNITFPFIYRYHRLVYPISISQPKRFFQITYIAT